MNISPTQSTSKKTWKPQRKKSEPKEQNQKREIAPELIKMACWSAENATNAFLKTLRMGENALEPDVAEFISALAAGNNAQLMVVATASAASSTTLALVAAAYQTGGRVVCIVRSSDELESSRMALGSNANHVEFAIGDAQSLLQTHYSEADFVLVDCNLGHHEGVLGSVRSGKRRNGALVVGFNALCNSNSSSSSSSQLLPIGEGLLVTRVPPSGNNKVGIGCRRRSQWIVKVDKCTGEEHVFRVRMPHGNNQIEA